MQEDDLTREERTEDVEPETETTPAETIVETAPQPKPEETVEFWKNKATTQAQENILLYDKIKQEESQKELTKEPTESEYRAAFPTWEAMSDTEKDLARRTFGAERIAAKAAKYGQEQQAERSWNTSIELQITSNPTLQGKEQAFRQFASQPKYRGVDMDLLINAFLNKNGAAPAPKATPKPGLETGNGGPRTPEKPKTISSKELEALRTSSPLKYREYLKTHEITMED